MGSNRVVYFVASHKNPGQLVRLVRVLRDGSCDSSAIVIHHNRAASELPSSAISAIRALGGSHLLAEHVSVEWGDFSFIEMMLLGFDWIASNIPDFAWIVFLSAQDYPIRPVPLIEQFLAQAEADAFLNYQEAERLESGIRDRYRYRFYKTAPGLKGVLSRSRPLNARQNLVRLVPGPVPQRYPRIGLRRLRTPFSGRWRCYKSVPWGYLSAAAVRSVRAFVRERPDIVRYYRRCHVPEESFLQTVLVNDPKMRVHNDNKRYAQWTHGSSHPDILRAADLEAMVSSGQHFARKFDHTVDAAVLDLLDERIGAAGSAAADRGRALRSTGTS